MKVIALSDLHGYLLELEKCDLVCICGDILPLDIQTNSRKTRQWLINEFKPWCESLPCDKVIFIAGNHDFYMSNLDFMYAQFPKNKKVTYLFHENYVYTSRSDKEYTIYGTPYCKIFGNWAFMKPDEELEKLYSKIPQNLDILLTHDQPYGYGDILLEDVPWNNNDHIGNKPLAKEVEIKQPKYMFVGHLHSTTHNCVKIKNTKRYNVSIKDERYNPTYKPLILDI